MEVEYKWELPEDAGDVLESPLVARALESTKAIEMRATYYDTPDGLLSQKHVGLRVRKENDSSVCCMKTPAESSGTAKRRNEYETAACDIIEGVEALKACGAPVELCDEILARGVAVTCETDFAREACTLAVKTEAGECKAELAFDRGEMRKGDARAPIHELELEFKGGSAEAFHEYAALLECEFDLQVQPKSKLARALAL